jgi:hypothetical protein
LIRRFRRFAQIGEDEPLELEARTAEVQQQTSLQAGGLEVIEQLGFLIAAEGLQRLEFDDDIFVTYEIGPVLAGQPPALIVNGQFLFSLKRDTTIRKLNRQCLLIDRLQKPWTKLSMHLHRRTDDGARLRVSRICVNLRNRWIHFSSPILSIRRLRRFSQIDSL